MASSKLDKLNKMVREREQVSISDRATPVDSLFNNEGKEESGSVPARESTPDKKKMVKPKVPKDVPEVKTKAGKEYSETESSGNEKTAGRSGKKKSPAKKNPDALTERKLGKEVNLENVKVSSWNCRISESLYLRFQLLMAMQGTTKSELINRIMEQEQKWLAAHPEFPDVEFQINALKRTRSAAKEEKEQSFYTTFALTSDNHAFVKEMSAKCLMKMYAYVSWIIEQYCDLSGIQKDV